MCPKLGIYSFTSGLFPDITARIRAIFSLQTPSHPIRTSVKNAQCASSHMFYNTFFVFSLNYFTKILAYIFGIPVHFSHFCNSILHKKSFKDDIKHYFE